MGRRLVWGTILGLMVPTAVSGAQQQPEAAEPETAVESSVSELAREAAEAFRTERFTESLALYERALVLASGREQQAALGMNRAACLIELGRFDDAERELARAAALDLAQSSRARLSMAALMLEQGRLDDAERTIVLAEPVPEGLQIRRDRLREQLAEERRRQHAARIATQMELARLAIVAHDFKRTQALLGALLEELRPEDRAVRIEVLHGLGIAALEQNQITEAKRILDEALVLAPEDPDLHYALARALDASVSDWGARASFRRALELGLEEPQAENARNRIRQLDPLPSTGWSGWFELAAGYDSNPRQSGTLTETSLGRRGRGGTPTVRAAAELVATPRLSEQVGLEAGYRGEFLALTNRPVQELSINEHAGFAGLRWAFSERSVVHFELGPRWTLLGLSEMAPFTREFFANARLRHQLTRMRSLRWWVGVAQISGATEWEFLGGTRIDTELSHAWHTEQFDLRLALRGRYLGIGRRDVAVDVNVIPACVGVCAGALYDIPLGYLGVGPGVFTRIALADSVDIESYGALDYRQYLEESGIAGVPESEKRRLDLRLTAGASLPIYLHRKLALVPSYGVLVSFSNMAHDPEDPEHAFDYDDRAFVQHLAELGVSLEF